MEKNREEYLEYLKQFYDFEIIKNPYDKRQKLYVINKQIKPYEPIISKPKKKRMKLKNKVYHTLSNNNIQTGASIFRILRHDIDILNLKYKESTLQQYIYMKLLMN